MTITGICRSRWASESTADYRTCCQPTYNCASVVAMMTAVVPTVVSITAVVAVMVTVSAIMPELMASVMPVIPKLHLLDFADLWS